MAARTSERRSRVIEALGFWFITLLICAIAGLGSYKFGRDWIGDRLGESVKPVLTTQELSERVGGGQEEAGGATDEGEVVPDEPPEKAIVEVTPTKPTVEDRQAARLDERPDERGRDEEATSESDRSGPERKAGSGDDKPARGREAAVREDERSDREPLVPSSAGGGKHAVRAGSFADRANADRMVTKLRAQGYQPYVTRVTKDGREYHRVNVATFDDRDQALKLRRDLRADGYAADISSE